MSDFEWFKMINTHLSGTLFCTREALKIMNKDNSGSIINMGSVLGTIGGPSSPHYSAAKGGILAYTRALARELASRNIRVNAIAPGYFKTPLNEALVKDKNFSEWLESRTPAGRWGEVSELIGACVFLSSNASSFVNGHILYVDGGITASL